MDGTGRLFTPLADHLQLHPVAYPDRAMSYDDLEDWLRPRLPTEPFGLLAESFSGPLALRIAARPPPALQRVVLVATFARAPGPIPPGAQLWSRPFFTVPPPAWAVRALLVGGHAPRQLVQAVRDALRSVSPSTMAARAEAIRTVDVRGRVPQVPTVHLVAGDDRLVPSGRSREIAAPRRTIPGPHLLCQVAPGAVADVLRV